MATIETTRTATTLTISAPELGKSITISEKDLSPSMLIQMAMLGCKNSLSDASALPKGSTVEDKWAAIRKAYHAILEGTFGVRTKGQGSGEPKGGILFNALCRLYAGVKSPETIRAYLDKIGRKGQATMLAKPPATLVVHIEAIRAEMAKSQGIDTEAMLDELDNL